VDASRFLTLEGVLPTLRRAATTAAPPDEPAAQRAEAARAPPRPRPDRDARPERFDARPDRFNARPERGPRPEREARPEREPRDHRAERERAYRPDPRRAEPPGPRRAPRVRPRARRFAKAGRTCGWLVRIGATACRGACGAALKQAMPIDPQTLQQHCAAGRRLATGTAMRSYSLGAEVPGAPGSPRPCAALLAQGHPADALVPEDRRRDGVLPPAERRPRRASPPAPAPTDRNGAPTAGERGERGARRRTRGERPGRRDEPAAKETMLAGLPFSVEVAARLFSAGATQGAEAPMCAARPPMSRQPPLRRGC